MFLSLRKMKKKRKYKDKAQNNELKHVLINVNSIKKEDKESKNNSNGIKINLEDKKELNLINDKDEDNKNIENFKNKTEEDLSQNHENIEMKDIESNGEIIINSKSENSINEEKQIDKISYENFVEIVFSKKRQLTELVNIKTEII